MVKKPTTNGCSCPNSLITPLNTFLLRLGQEILWLCHCTTRNLWQGGTNVLDRKVDCKGWISIQFSMIFPWFFHHPQPPPRHLWSWVSKGVPRYISCHSPTCVTGGLVEGANRLASRIFSTFRLGLWHPTEADVPWIFRARWRDGMALNREF